jgi:thiamine pyrophosphokinase
MSHILVVADGRAPDRDRLDGTWPGWSSGIAEVVAADGGAVAAARLGFRPDLLVGDLDSIDATTVDELEAAGVAIERASGDKDETDTELAILAALRRGASRITVLGAIGGSRLDHELANIVLLALPAARSVPMVLLDERARVRLLVGPGSADLPGPVGGLVSLIPLGDGVVGVTTRGLRYPLRDEALPFGPARGISNVRLQEAATVAVQDGRLLIIETPATLDR